MGVPVHQLRAALVDVALWALSREVLAATSTRAIVEVAGMSLANLHYAFDARDDQLGREHVRTTVTIRTRLPSSA